MSAVQAALHVCHGRGVESRCNDPLGSSAGHEVIQDQIRDRVRHAEVGFVGLSADQVRGRRLLDYLRGQAEVSGEGPDL